MKSHARVSTLFAAALFLLPPTGHAGTTVDLVAEATRTAPNDMARASVFAEASGNAAGELAKKVNAQVSEGLQTAKAYRSIKSRSGSISTHPTYAKGGRIESWRMRSEIILESTDITAMSELLGKLQTNLGVGQLLLLPADETRRRAEDEATLAAIADFRERAARVAAALGKGWKIKHLSLNAPPRQPLPTRLRAAPMMAEAAPMPIDAGESEVSVSISGQIELAD